MRKTNSGPLACPLVGLLFACALASACQRAPEVAREHLRRGDAELAEGHYAQALAAYSHAREVAPADPDVQNAMMRARVHLIAESAARLNPDAFEDARYEASYLLEMDKPRAPVYLTALGNVLLRQGDIEAAKIKFAEALAVDSNSALAHTALGLALMSRKESASQAKTQFELALKAKPTDAGALIGLGQIEVAEGNLAGAADHFEAALRVRDDLEARLGLASARAQQQKHADAIPHFQRAVELAPKNADALGGLGQSLLAVGKAADAERALRAAIEARRDPNTLIALGFALSQQKKAGSALDVFLAVLADDPSSPPALFGAGSANEDLGRKEQAIELYRRLLAIEPNGPARSAVADLQRDAQKRLNALAPPEPADKDEKKEAPKQPARAPVRRNNEVVF